MTNEIPIPLNITPASSKSASNGRSVIVEIDDTDRALIRALNENGRASQRELARELGVALGTVSARLQKLEAAGVIRGYLPDVDPERLGYTLVVVIGLRISKGQLLAVQAEVARHPAVYGVYDVTGDWDSLVLARFQTRQTMDAFIKHALAMPYVERTYTHVVLNTVKEERRVGV